MCPLWYDHLAADGPRGALHRCAGGPGWHSEGPIGNVGRRCAEEHARACGRGGRGSLSVCLPLPRRDCKSLALASPWTARLRRIRISGRPDPDLPNGTACNKIGGVGQWSDQLTSGSVVRPGDQWSTDIELRADGRRDDAGRETVGAGPASNILAQPSTALPDRLPLPCRSPIPHRQPLTDR